MSTPPVGEASSGVSFRDLNLAESVLAALADVGYELPSPIQAATIPVLLSGADMLGQAQTGTGKTAAFALPALSRIELARLEPQVLVLVPTRELALQVAEAFQRYAAHLKGFHVLPIYGGQSYQPQLNALRRGVHVVVGTPGRVIDHIDRGTLKLGGLSLLVLDEADEMLAMGFVDAVESILTKTPPQRQVALFSATLAAPIRRIAQRHLRAPVEVTIKSKTSTATNIRQRYWVVSGVHKLDALTRILEAESFDAMLVFTRTKQSTVELAEKLEARGFAAAALNGDIPQALRERTVARLKSGQIDILVATDVAARGLDVERIGHVVNYDVPYDTESYVHRIGRTGRAGRNGEAILFIAPRERNMLRAIERATRQTLEQMNLPSIDAVNAQRIAKFKQRVIETVANGEAGAYLPVIEQLEAETGLAASEIAAALASLSQGATPLLLPARHEPRESVAAKQESREAVAAKYEPRKPLSARHEPGELQAAGHPRPDRVGPARDTGAAPVPAAVHETQPVAPREPHVKSPPVQDRKPSSNDAQNSSARPKPSARPNSSARQNAGARQNASAPQKFAARQNSVVGQNSSARQNSIDRQNSIRAQMETFRLEVGSMHGIKPGNIVGAIANEAGIEGVHIGRVDIREDHSFIDLPEGMPKPIFNELQTVRLAGRELRISRVTHKPPKPPRNPAGRHADRKVLTRRS
jgi:ATP-dependent RNA helicase DeaD